MKKKIFGAVLITVITFVGCWNFNQSKKKALLSNLILANIEALAQSNESSTEEKGKSPETKRCKKTFPDGTFTSSVERVCTPSCSSCTCTPVPCGEPFYN
ncbi:MULTISPECIES: NVEALA domain-containing protein [unclassified Parabacteroides]|jgi:hypothetical protein|uniref:NVEALA domain-containing protein n=1 Tax=unclassified Parabacteroides TaxID=2649774 RepID=UPI000F0025C4|nr:MULTISPECIES: NVEALA domain-containing protein [unclassified Parabacteroides]RHR42076.1 hypothetical protein DWX23_05930 [Parabacteroides sp. AF18-52]RHR91258.1 hypothetical protein DWW23_25960 [Parabacteroides sp. AF14-59]